MNESSSAFLYVFLIREKNDGNKFSVLDEKNEGKWYDK